MSTDQPSGNIWIVGVIVTLVGHVSLNIGVNLQKYSHTRYLKQKAEREKHLKREDANASFAPDSSTLTLVDDPAHASVDSEPPTPSNGSPRISTTTLPLANDSLPPPTEQQLDSPEITIASTDTPASLSEEAKPPIPPPKKKRCTFNCQDSYFGRPIWWLGFFIFLAGNIATFVALGFAPQTLLSPLSCISLVSNAIVAALFLGEKFYWKIDIFALAAIVAGTILIIIFASNQSKKYSVEDLWEMALKTEFLIFAIVCVLGLISGYIFITYCRRKLARNQLRPNLRRALAIIIAAYSGNLSSWTVLTGKAVSEMLQTSFGGDNQFRHPMAFIMTAVMVMSAVGQLHWLNVGLSLFDSLIFNPTLSVFWLIFNILGGAFYYNEFSTMSATQIAFFCVGVLCNFFGVYLLSRRQLWTRRRAERKRKREAEMAARAAEAEAEAETETETELETETEFDTEAETDVETPIPARPQRAIGRSASIAHPHPHPHPHQHSGHYQTSPLPAQGPPRGRTPHTTLPGRMRGHRRAASSIPAAFADPRGARAGPSSRMAADVSMAIPTTDLSPLPPYLGNVPALTLDVSATPHPKGRPRSNSCGPPLRLSVVGGEMHTGSAFAMTATMHTQLVLEVAPTFPAKGKSTRCAATSPMPSKSVNADTEADAEADADATPVQPPPPAPKQRHARRERERSVSPCAAEPKRNKNRGRSATRVEDFDIESTPPQRSRNPIDTPELRPTSSGSSSSSSLSSSSKGKTPADETVAAPPSCTPTPLLGSGRSASGEAFAQRHGATVYGLANPLHTPDPQDPEAPPDEVVRPQDD